MDYNKQLMERNTCNLQQECTYLTRLIQQHKLFHRRKGNRSFNSQTSPKVGWSDLRSYGTTNASVSKYKKINVSTKPQVPLVDKWKLCADNNPTQSQTMKCASKKKSVSPSPTVSKLHESQPLTYATSYASCQNVPDSRSSRMYLNPHFFKANNCLQTDISAKYVASESADVSKPKHSVHINPKVLAAQVMKLAAQSEPTQTHALVNRCTANKKHETGLPTCEPLSQPSNSNVTKKYVFHSKTKLVKQNAVISSMVANPVTMSHFVPEKKLSPLIKSSLSGPLMSVSRTKLVRAKSRRSCESFQGLSNNSPSVISPYTFHTTPKAVGRLSLLSCSRNRTVAVKAAKAVCSKYKLTRSNITKTPVTKSRYSYTANKITPRQESRYKIDRRLNKTVKRLKKVKKYSLQYEMPKSGGPNQHITSPKLFNKYEKVQYPFTSLKFGNKTWNNSLRPRKVMVVDKKLRRIGSSPNLGKGRDHRFNQQSSNLVRIGGVLYRTSKLKLTRSLTPKCKNEGGRNVADYDVKKPKSRSSFAVYVRGNKFLMDATGKTMLRVRQRSKKPGFNELPLRNLPLKRIDIGGVTFVQKSTNVLVRTNTHNARSLLSQAKQKSIALLTKKLRKSNQPCIFYHRFGKCMRKEMGTCPHVHDPKHVVVCKKFLQGCCAVDGCTLSHDVGPEKMPTCKYFLEGCCVRDGCPYLHVKVNEKAGICKDFLHGYCFDGQKCRKRHTYLCPEFEKTGCCPKGKYCPYPHKTVVKKKSRTRKHSTAKDVVHIASNDDRKRYYETVGMVSEVFPVEPEDSQVTNGVDGSDLNVKRLKLLKKVDDMKRAWQNAQCNTVGQMSSTPSLVPESMEPETKRPKLGILPAYIPLGSDSK